MTEQDRPATDEQPLPLDPKDERAQTDDAVDDASDDSFPASDPPSFTATTTSRDAEPDSGDGQAH